MSQISPAARKRFIFRSLVLAAMLFFLWGIFEQMNGYALACSKHGGDWVNGGLVDWVTDPAGSCTLD